MTNVGKSKKSIHLKALITSSLLKKKKKKEKLINNEKGIIKLGSFTSNAGRL